MAFVQFVQQLKYKKDNLHFYGYTNHLLALAAYLQHKLESGLSLERKWSQQQQHFSDFAGRAEVLTLTQAQRGILLAIHEQAGRALDTRNIIADVLLNNMMTFLNMTAKQACILSYSGVSTGTAQKNLQQHKKML